MKQVFTNKYFLLIARFVVGFVFIYAGAEKITDPGSFSDSILNYKLFPLAMANITAITLPWIEITSGILLILGITVKENAAMISFLLLFFIVIIVISLIRGLNIDCGCFGSEAHRIGINKIIENTFLLVLGIILTVHGSDFLSIDNNLTAKVQSNQDGKL